MDEIFIGIPQEKIVSPAENRKNRKLAIEEWRLGPENPSIDRTANKAYWKDLGKALGVDEKEARRRMCANCEYFCNGPMKQAMMEAIPLDDYDTDAGGRGYCKKFDFICHNLRSCQAWEED